MAKVLITEKYLEDIADAIRAKHNTDATYTPAVMATAITNIPVEGVEIDSHEWEDWRMTAQTYERIKESYTNDRINMIGNYALAGCNIKRISIPNATTIGTYGLYETCYVNVLDLPSLKIATNNSFNGLAGNLYKVNLDNLEKVGLNSFANITTLKAIRLPNLVEDYNSLFKNSNGLLAIGLPKFEGSSNSSAEFQGCSKLVGISLPNAKAIYNTMFQNCSALKIVDFGEYATTIPTTSSYNSPFYGYSAMPLDTLILRSPTVVELKIGADSLLSVTQIAKGAGYIYVPQAIIEDYKTATNWAVLASQFRAIEDYPAIANGWCGYYHYPLDEARHPNGYVITATGPDNEFHMNNPYITACDDENCVSVGSNGLKNCENLVYVRLPKCETVYGLENNPKLEVVDLPAVEGLYNSALSRCSNLALIDLPETCKKVNATMQDCPKLTTVIFRSKTMVSGLFQTLNGEEYYPFKNSPVKYIYVPEALLNEYKNDANWSRYKNKFIKIEGSDFDF